MYREASVKENKQPKSGDFILLLCCLIYSPCITQIKLLLPMNSQCYECIFTCRKLNPNKEAVYLVFPSFILQIPPLLTFSISKVRARQFTRKTKDRV